jgi:hypothetical protein
MTEARLAPHKDAMTKPPGPARPEIGTAIPAADNHWMRTACRHNDRGHKYRRRRQQYGQTERVHHDPDGEPSRLRRHRGRTYANRYETDKN